MSALDAHCRRRRDGECIVFPFNRGEIGSPAAGRPPKIFYPRPEYGSLEQYTGAGLHFLDPGYQAIAMLAKRALTVHRCRLSVLDAVFSPRS